MQKNQFRKKCLEQRRLISNKDEKSLLICEELLKLDIYKNSRTIAVYLAKKEEVNLSFLINKALQDGKNIVIPKITNNCMKFYIYHVDEELIISSFHILEPKGEERYMVNNTSIDLFIVPGVAFDFQNHRMGYGKGYYDKYLKDSKGYKIGVAFKEMVFDKIPYDDNDIPMDMVIAK